MATAVFTDTEMTLFGVQSNASGGSDWQTIVKPAWQASGSMNGASGTVTYNSPAAPTTQLMIQPFALLDDDLSVPPVITVTNLRFQFSWTVSCSAATEITDSLNTEAVSAGGGSGSYDETADPTAYWGGTDRATMFSSPVVWGFYTAGASASQAITVTGYTVTVTYSVPATPQVTAINPPAGSVNGNTNVAITGEGFTGAPGATLGGVALTAFVVVSDTRITGTTGEHASGLVDVEVTGVGTLVNGYTYVIPPNFRLLPIPTRTPIAQGGGKGGR